MEVVATQCCFCFVLAVFPGSADCGRRSRSLAVVVDSGRDRKIATQRRVGWRDHFGKPRETSTCRLCLFGHSRARHPAGADLHLAWFNVLGLRQCDATLLGRGRYRYRCGGICCFAISAAIFASPEGPATNLSLFFVVCRPHLSFFFALLPQVRRELDAFASAAAAHCRDGACGKLP